MNFNGVYQFPVMIWTGVVPMVSTPTFIVGPATSSLNVFVSSQPLTSAPVINNILLFTPNVLLIQSSMINNGSSINTVKVNGVLCLIVSVSFTNIASTCATNKRFNKH